MMFSDSLKIDFGFNPDDARALSEGHFAGFARGRRPLDGEPTIAKLIGVAYSVGRGQS
jgi:hypothetical protein